MVTGQIGTGNAGSVGAVSRDDGRPTVLESVSPSVHPAVVEHLSSAFVIGATDAGVVHHPAYTSGLAAMDALWNTSALLAEAEHSLKDSGRDPASERRLRASAEANLAKARKAAEGALDTLAQHREQTDAAIVEALGIRAAREEVTTALRASAIRASMARCDPRKRAEELHNILHEDDVESAAAILAAPCRASGLTAKEHAAFRKAAELKFAGKAVELRESLDRLRTVVDRAAQLTEERFGPLAGLGGSAAARREAALRALEKGGAA